jgi:hypothetical protein
MKEEWQMDLNLDEVDLGFVVNLETFRRFDLSFTPPTRAIQLPGFHRLVRGMLPHPLVKS